MATQVQIRRGTTAQNLAFTGVEGELTYDTQIKRLRVHDGITVGGTPVNKNNGDTMTGLLAFSGASHAGIRLNNLTTANRNALVASPGMTIWNINTNRLEVANQSLVWITHTKLAGDTMTGLLQFSGVTHAGVRLNNLTTAERDAIAVPTDGMIIFNTTTGQFEGYDSGWGPISGGGSSPPFVDTTALVMGSADNSKLLRFEVDGFTAATTRVLTPQNADYTIAGLETSNAFVNANTIIPTTDVIPLKLIALAAPAVSNIFEAWKTGETSGFTIDHNGSIVQTIYFDNAVSGSRHDFRRRGTTGNENAAITTDTPIMEFRAHGWDGATFGLTTRITSRASENFSAAGWGSYLVFATTQSGTTAVPTEVMRLTTLASGAFVTFGGATSSFPALKRVGAQLTVRLADDSADAVLQASRFISTGTANLESFVGTGYSLTGANAQSMFDLAGTWNTTGEPTAIKLAITNTASGTNSFFLNFLLDSVSRFSVSKLGVTTINFTNAGQVANNALNLTNTTAAAAGAQQYSPSLRWTGQGWKTNAVAASQTLEWRAYMRVVQGAAAPTGNLDFDIQINGTGFLNVLSILSGGGISVTGGAQTTGSLTMGATSSLLWSGRGSMKSSANGIIELFDAAQTGFTRLNFGGVTSSFPAITRSGAAFILTLADGTGSAAITTGNHTMTTAALLSINSGTNQRAGNAVLVAGTITVANTTVTANTIVMLTRKTSGGTIGTAITYTVSAGNSFTITSDSVLDTSTFSYLLIEVP